MLFPVYIPRPGRSRTLPNVVIDPDSMETAPSSYRGSLPSLFQHNRISRPHCDTLPPYIIEHTSGAIQPTRQPIFINKSVAPAILDPRKKKPSRIFQDGQRIYRLFIYRCGAFELLHGPGFCIPDSLWGKIQLVSNIFCRQANHI